MLRERSWRSHLIRRAQEAGRASLTVPHYCVGAAYLVGSLVMMGVATQRDSRAAR